MAAGPRERAQPGPTAAKRRLLKRLGAALRSVSGRIDTTPLYYQLFRMGIEEPSSSVRLAAAQEIGSGGNEAFAVIRERIGLNSDPVQEYNDRVGELRLWKRRQFETWARRMAGARTDRPPSRATLSERIDRLQHERQDLNQEYRRRRVALFREFVMRAWMIPMLLGSVDDAHRDEARERLTKWLRHLDPKFTGGAPDLPLALEAVLAQGFKYVANRRKRHPHAYPRGRADLMRQAEKVLQQSRWELPDRVGHHHDHANHDDTVTGPEGDGHGVHELSEAIGGMTAVQTVERWLSMAGTVSGAPGRSNANGARPGGPYIPSSPRRPIWWPSRWRPGSPSGTCGSTRRAPPTPSAPAPVTQGDIAGATCGSRRRPAGAAWTRGPSTSSPTSWSC
ncbi:hypothetical protein OH768_17950 [Streptomyces sp. NBC_01622]|uniref:hypothetical protein n=1 Tax=Streptomyces sp. NBC_01622 TaxID=2975903 RepID=UPI0038699247|nr:hypothetical protein OH768_17950 [Streptomyces sp. NBC_01622]